ncbi:MAG: FlgD immunoglobulin-like domain containing protein [Calditrichaceae bacterium]
MAINSVPAEFSLQGNYPNPFNPVTTIRFGLPEAANVKLVIYSVTGAKVATLVDGYLSEGYHEAKWNGVNQAGARVASGIYIYELISGEKRFIKKMLLAK